MDLQEAQARLIQRREELSRTILQESNTSAATLTSSPGTKNLTCPEHGDYEAKVIAIPLLGEERKSGCPKCKEVRIAEFRRQEEERAEFKRQALIRRYTGSSGIPRRFERKTLDDIAAKSPAQKGVLKAVKGYLHALIKGTSVSLILCGKPGTGKTHIGCALVMGAINACKEARIVTTGNLMRQVKATYHKDSEESEDTIFTEYGGLDLLVIDEVGVQFGTETEKLIFYEVIDRRYNNMLPTVLISNLTAAELQVFIGERAFDRFKEDGGAVLAFDWDSHRGQ